MAETSTSAVSLGFIHSVRPRVPTMPPSVADTGTSPGSRGGMAETSAISARIEVISRSVAPS